MKFDYPWNKNFSHVSFQPLPLDVIEFHPFQFNSIQLDSISIRLVQFTYPSNKSCHLILFQPPLPLSFILSLSIFYSIWLSGTVCPFCDFLFSSEIDFLLVLWFCLYPLKFSFFSSFSDLKADAEYQFRIVAENFYGQSPASEPTAPVKTKKKEIILGEWQKTNLFF